MATAHEHVVQEQPPSALALDRTVRRFAVVLRCGGVVAAGVVAGIGDGDGISRTVQGLVFAGLGTWALVFSVVALRWKLTATLVAADVVIIALVVSVQTRLVPAAAISDGSTWVVALASTSVFIAMWMLRPVLGVPLAGVVVVAYAVGAPGGVAQLGILGIQIVVTGVMRRFLHQAGAHAEEVVAKAAAEEQAAQIAAVRRADEREYHRRMHDTVLSTLTAVAIGIDRDSPALRADLQRSLKALGEFDAPAVLTDDQLVDLEVCLRATVSEAPEALAVELTALSIRVPVQVAEALTAAAGEALRNTLRHGRVPCAKVVAQNDSRWIQVEIIDHGVGFDPSLVPGSKRGVRESIIGRMEVVGGSATVESSPGVGTRVVLRWPHG